MADLREYSVSMNFKLTHGYSEAQLNRTSPLEQSLKDAQHQVLLINSHRVGKMIKNEFIVDKKRSDSERAKMLEEYKSLNSNSRISYLIDPESGMVKMFYQGRLYYPKK